MRPKVRLVVIVGVMLALGLMPLLAAGQSGQHAFGTPEFQQVWERTDLPIQEGMASRTWMWGLGANTPVLQEPYAEGTGGIRDVQYTDKSRMEMPVHPVEPDSDWFITQGLLATELMTGNMQMGDTSFVQHDPSDAFVAGDPVNNQSPTYAQMGQLIDQSPRDGGGVITEMIQPDGSVTENPQVAGYGVTDAQHVGQTDNHIASVFWDFMNSTGTVYHNGQYGEGPLFTNPFYAIGFPVTEAFWGNVTVDTSPQMVLMQCFERRCLTFTPENDPAWQVESGNIGQHYYDWRYNQPHYPDDDATDDTSPPAADDTPPPSADDTPPPSTDDTPPATGDDSTDDSAPSPEPRMLIVHPDQSQAKVYTTYTFTVEVLDGDLEPYPGAQVQGQVVDTTGGTEAHLNAMLTPDPATTGPDGFATLSLTGSELGVDTISFDVIGSDVEQRTAEHTWEPGCVTEGESIQAAIDASQGASFQAAPGEGHICVESGTYNEALTITGDDLTLIAQGDVVLDGSGVSATQGISIFNSERSMISGFEIRNFQNDGVFIRNGGSHDLSDLHISSVGSYGVRTASDEPGNLQELYVNDVVVEGVPGEAEEGPIGMQFVSAYSVTIDNSELLNIAHGAFFSGDAPTPNGIPRYEVTNTTFDVQGNSVGESAGAQLLVADNRFQGGSTGITLPEGEGYSVQIEGNRFEGLDQSVRIEVNRDISIIGNIFIGNHFGVYSRSEANGDRITIAENDFINTEAFAVTHESSASGTVDARHNFWGHSSGPSGVGPGTGDEVSNNVDFDPWDSFPNSRL
jgi:hypothetical protein